VTVVLTLLLLLKHPLLPLLLLQLMRRRLPHLVCIHTSAEELLTFLNDQHTALLLPCCLLQVSIEEGASPIA
jgi:hypothetical protein